MLLLQHLLHTSLSEKIPPFRSMFWSLHSTFWTNIRDIFLRNMPTREHLNAAFSAPLVEALWNRTAFRKEISLGSLVLQEALPCMPAGVRLDLDFPTSRDHFLNTLRDTLRLRLRR